MYENLKEWLEQNLRPYFDKAKFLVFGQNNENLDFVIDSFYKLEAEKQRAVLAAIGVGVSVFILLAFGVYFAQVNKLQGDLAFTYEAINEIKRVKSEDELETARFNKMVDLVTKKTDRLAIKPFFEKLAQDEMVEVKGIAEKEVDIEMTNPLSKKFKEVQVELKLPKISVPKVLNFMISLEKSDHFFRIQDLKIAGQFGNRLFFDVTMVVRTYRPTGS